MSVALPKVNVMTQQFASPSKINIFQDGWDDEEDAKEEEESVYLPMAPIPDPSNSPRVKKSEVESIVTQTESLSLSPPPVVMITRRRSSSGSDDEILYADEEEPATKKAAHRSRSTRIVSKGLKVHGKQNNETSRAGLAAKKYLLRNESALKRSPTSGGRKGAVQHRINRSKTSKIVTTSEGGLSPVGLVEYLEDESTPKTIDNSIFESKRKSKTLDRNLNAVSACNETINGFFADNEVISKEKHGGSSVIKMIGNGSRSKSLDGKFLEYLAGVSNHTSRTSSSATAQSTEPGDDEEEFQKFAQSVAAMGNIRRSDGDQVTLTEFLDSHANAAPQKHHKKRLASVPNAKYKTKDYKTAMAAEKFYQKQEKQRRKAEKELVKSKSKSWDRLSGSIRGKGRRKRPELSIAKSTNTLCDSVDGGSPMQTSNQSNLHLDTSAKDEKFRMKSATLGRKAKNNQNPGPNQNFTNFDEKFTFEKSNTLSRMFARKFAKSQGQLIDNDYTKPNVQELFNSGSLGRKMSTITSLISSTGTLKARRRNSILTIDEIYFYRPYFHNGIRLEGDDNDDSFEDVDFIIESKVKSSATLSTVNKYATLTGSPLSKRKAFMRQTSLQNNMETTQEVSSEKPSKSFSGPSNPHLSFSEALLEGTEINFESELPENSPLRPRKNHKIEPLVQEPSKEIVQAACLIYNKLSSERPELLQCLQVESEQMISTPMAEQNGINKAIKKDCAYGHELVTFLYNVYKSAHEGQEVKDSSMSRGTVCGMFQALLEEGAMEHVRREEHFKDEKLLYRFSESVMSSLDDFKEVTGDEKTRNGRPVSVDSGISSVLEGDGLSVSGSADSDALAQLASSDESRSGSVASRSSFITSSTHASDKRIASYDDGSDFHGSLSYLKSVSPDALFRMVLRKQPGERTAEELMMVYEEILHIKALTHLSDSVKRELAAVLKFEYHKDSRKTLFKQGDEGRSWYIIVKGSVEVVIAGKSNHERNMPK